MRGYQPIEAAVRQHILTAFSDLLNEERCQVSNIDRVFQSMLAEDSPYGLVLDYSAGSRQTRPPFAGTVWVWQIMGFFMIRYYNNPAEHDQQVRNIIDRLPHLFEADHRLGGVTDLINVVAISTPEPEKINDVPLYWLAFNIEAVDK